MRPIHQALNAMLPAFGALPAERLDIVDATGRVLTEDLIAQIDSPAFTNSAMDGYAVRADEAGLGAVLPVHGESRAGGPPPRKLMDGHVMRIFTGAPVPPGADAVVLQEDVDRKTDATSDTITLREAAKAGKNIRVRGEDLARGAVLLARGTRLDPGAVGLLASQGIGSVLVHRRPRVAILASGDELRTLDDPPREGSIVNSNAYALSAAIAEAGADAWPLPIAPDDLEALTEAVKQGLMADVLLTTGGVSVGDHDLMRAAFEAAGVQSEFWKVAIKPGKPMAFGRATVGERLVPVVGLPGNPVSAMVTFYTFVQPGLQRMLGRLSHPAPVLARLAAPARHRTGRTELVRASLRPGTIGGEPSRPAAPESTLPTATLVTRRGSGALPALAGVDVLVVLPSEQAEFAEGEVVVAIPLRPSFSSHDSVFGALGV